ncbi:VWA domain-containing protein [Candidatus Pacearchaeota archaeon]|nr:VWA domain-containing protein [Candidatus Pacearchaeota archaeon]
MLEIQNLAYLNLFFLIPVVILIHVISLKIGRKRALRFANIEAIERVKGFQLFSKNLTSLYIFIFALILFILAAAGTRYSFERQAPSFSFVIAIDNSLSMSARDILPSRLRAAKDSAKLFIDAMPFGTEFGIVSFSGTAKVEHEITQDKQSLKRAVDLIGSGEVGGTNILDAVEKSRQMFKKNEPRAIILLSDGQINVESVIRIIEYAKQYNILISSVGIGTKEGGQAEFFISKLDEDSLKAIAYNTGGNYYTAETIDSLNQAFNDISLNTRKTVYIELRDYLIFAALFLLVVWWFLINTRLRGIP